jgi:hypothetical protein
VTTAPPAPPADPRGPRRARVVAAVLLVVVAGGALVLDTASTALLRRLLAGRHGWLLDLHLPELVAGLALYFATGPAGTWRLPSKGMTPRQAWLVPVVWVGVWIVATGIVVAVAGRGAWSKAAGLVVTHVVGQELLFRGAVYQLAERVWPAKVDDPDGIAGWAVLFSGLLYGLAQLQYGGFAVTGPIVWMAVRAFLLGSIMAFARPYFRSLWPGATFHAISNGLYVLRG